MQVSVETTQGLERKLTVTVPSEAIDSRVEERLNSMKKSVKVNGFRPGKVPMSVIKKRYEGQVRGYLREAIKAPDAAPQTWNNLGVLLMDRGQIPEAVEVLRRAFALSNGENDEIRDNLRLALAMKDKTVYDPTAEEELDLVRSGSGRYRLREQIP